MSRIPDRWLAARMLALSLEFPASSAREILELACAQWDGGSSEGWPWPPVTPAELEAYDRCRGFTPPARPARPDLDEAVRRGMEVVERALWAPMTPTEAALHQTAQDALQRVLALPGPSVAPMGEGSAGERVGS